MSRDLLLGRTRRDWSLGAEPMPTAADRRQVASDLWARGEVQALGVEVGELVRKTFATIEEMTADKTLPPKRRREFAPILRRWQELAARRASGGGPKFEVSDYVELYDLRGRVRQYAEGLRPTIPASGEVPPSAKARPPAPESHALRNLVLGAAVVPVAIHIFKRRTT